MKTIHDDLVYQILLWLPITPLFRFKSVCKTWFSIIQTSQFIDQHRLHRHVHHPYSEDNLLVKNKNILSPVFSIISGENYQISDDISGSFTQNSFSRDCHVIVASCNGIICHVDRKYSDPQMIVTLWNPATQQSKVLPKSCIRLSLYILDQCDVYFGFFYDGKTDDYKVIRFISSYATNHIEIYNLSTDSWRDITCELPITDITSDPRVPYRKQTYCWLGVNDNTRLGTSGPFVLLTFDITKEVFGTMTLPDEYSIKKQKQMLSDEFSSDDLDIEGIPRLAIIRDEMLLIIIPLFSSETDINIWVLNDYGDKRLWTKSYTLQLGSRIDWMGTSINGIIFVLRCEKYIRDQRNYIRTEDRKLCLYNTDTGETNILPISRPDKGCLEVVQYKRSLVSIESKVPSVKKHRKRQRR